MSNWTPFSAARLTGTAALLVAAYLKAVEPLLTEEEKKELKDHPVGSAGMEALHLQQNANADAGAAVAPAAPSSSSSADPVVDKEADALSVRMRLRKSIARKMWLAVKEKALSSADEKQKEIYERFPPYLFYSEKDKQGEEEEKSGGGEKSGGKGGEEGKVGGRGRARRAYGVCTYEPKEKGGKQKYGLHMVSAMIMFCNAVVGGVAVENVVAVESWSKEQRGIIQLCPAAPFFYDPCGWIVFPYV